MILTQLIQVPIEIYDSKNITYSLQHARNAAYCVISLVCVRVCMHVHACVSASACVLRKLSFII